jgi:hypothetical protein
MGQDGRSSNRALVPRMAAKPIGILNGRLKVSLPLLLVKIKLML